MGAFGGVIGPLDAALPASPEAAAVGPREAAAAAILTPLSAILCRASSLGSHTGSTSSSEPLSSVPLNLPLERS